jgi:lipopolysaccharide biosynthesis glycosyltransferase
MDIAVDRGSLSQYARLFVSSNLSVNLRRVRYLDCDIIINESIKKLWNRNLDGKTIGALMHSLSIIGRT